MQFLRVIPLILGAFLIFLSALSARAADSTPANLVHTGILDTSTGHEVLIQPVLVDKTTHVVGTASINLNSIQKASLSLGAVIGSDIQCTDGMFECQGQGLLVQVE